LLLLAAILIYDLKSGWHSILAKLSWSLLVVAASYGFALVPSMVVQESHPLRKLVLGLLGLARAWIWRRVSFSI
jgi:hypothetical protein